MDTKVTVATPQAAIFTSTKKMKRLVETQTSFVVPTGEYVARNLKNSEPYTFVMTDQDDLRNRGVNFCLTNMNASDAPTSVAYYLAALSIFMPALLTDAKNCFTSSGYTLRENPLPMVSNSMEDSMFGKEEPPTKLLVQLGLAILLMFENINEANYTSFISNRSAAISFRIGHVGSRNVKDLSPVFSDYDKAEAIRTFMNNKHTFRASMLRCILENQGVEGSIGGLCRYLAGILAWNGMEAPVAISEMLLTTKSPVIFDKEVRSEAYVLYEVFFNVNNSEMPQYYNILNPYLTTRFMETSRFPIIAAVAQVLKAEIIANFVLPCEHPLPIQGPLVQRLVALHKKHMVNAPTTSTSDPKLSYLTDFEEDGDELTAGNAG